MYVYVDLFPADGLAVSGGDGQGFFLGQLFLLEGTGIFGYRKISKISKF
jgi:hypothetical protein